MRKVLQEDIMKIVFNISLFFIFLISCCVNNNILNYDVALKKQLKMLGSDLSKELKEKNVIIIGDPLFIGIYNINGIEVSQVIISSKIIYDPEKRYLISHLIRNIIIQDAIIYNFDDLGNNLVMYPVMDIDNEFIYENKQLILDVLYYLLHKDYFNLYGNLGSSGEKIFYSSLLEIINDDVNHLQRRLINENSLDNNPFGP